MLKSIQQTHIRPNIVTNGLALYLPLWEREGAVIQSKDATGHLATSANSTWTPLGRVFNGSNSVITLGGSVPSLFTSGFTFEVWVKFAALGTLLIVTRTQAGTWANANDRQFYLDGGVFHMDVFGLGGISSNEGPAAGVFCHMALTNESDAQIWYVNGNPCGTGALGVSASPDPVTNICRLGQYGNDALVLNGTIGEIRAYSRPLRPFEIQRNYLSTKWRYR